MSRVRKTSIGLNYLDRLMFLKLLVAVEDSKNMRSSIFDWFRVTVHTTAESPLPEGSLPGKEPRHVGG